MPIRWPDTFFEMLSDILLLLEGQELQFCRVDLALELFHLIRMPRYCENTVEPF